MIRNAVRVGLLLAALAAGCAGPGLPSPPEVAALQPPAGSSAAAAAAGIEVASLHMSAAGRIVDFRYRVLDAAKAKTLLSRQVEPHAFDQATGTRLIVPRAGKVGALRQSSAKVEEGRVYFILFGNTDRVVKQGSRITVVVGEVRIPDLLVE